MYQNNQYTHPILSCEASKDFEAKIFANDTSGEHKAIQRAGRMLGQAVLRDFREIAELPERVKVLILAGKGHNAGDAIVAADEILRYYPKGEAHIILAMGETVMKPIVSETLKAVQHVVKTFIYSIEEMDTVLAKSFDICLDGIFAMQFQPPLQEPVRGLILKVNESSRIRFRVAVDIPSGVCEKEVEEAFRADITYATGILKTPILKSINSIWVGRIRYLDIGFFDEKHPEFNDKNGILLPDVLKPLQCMRTTQTYKRSYGHVFILAGSRMMPGAALMAVCAALLSGVGLVTGCVPKSFVGQFAASVPEAMWIGMPETEMGGMSLEGVREVTARIGDCRALVIGPGMGREHETQILIAEVIAKTDVPLMLDADALFPKNLEKTRARIRKRIPVCVTPHEGEFKRIAGGSDFDEEFVRAYVIKKQIHLLLKGPMTRITDGTQIIYSPYGNPVLARGGSGDVLSGLVGGLLAQGAEDPLRVLCTACAWHGLAADALARERGQVAATAMDLLPHLHRVLRDYEC